MLIFWGFLGAIKLFKKHINIWVLVRLLLPLILTGSDLFHVFSFNYAFGTDFPEGKTLKPQLLW